MSYRLFPAIVLTMTMLAGIAYPIRAGDMDAGIDWETSMDTEFWSSGGNPVNSTYPTWNPIGRDITFGGEGVGFTAIHDAVIMEEGDFTIRSAPNPGPDGRRGVTLDLGDFILYDADLVIEKGVSATDINAMTITYLLEFNGASSITLNEHTSLSTGTFVAYDPFTFNLNGGQLELQYMNPVAGTFNVTKDSLITVRDQLRLEKGSIVVSNGSVLTIGKSGGDGFGQVYLYDDVLDIRDGSTIRTGDTVLSMASFAGGDQYGNLEIHGDLLVDGFSQFNDDAGVATTVTGTTTVLGTYNVAGDNNVYHGDMTIQGTLSNRGDAAITIADGRTIHQSGNGKIMAAADTTLRIQGQTVMEIESGGTVLDASAGRLDLADSSVHVTTPGDGRDIQFFANRGIDVGRYRQDGGIVTVAGTGEAGRFTVHEQAVIGGDSGVSAAFLADGDAVRFAAGVTVNRNGSLGSGAMAGTIHVGLDDDGLVDLAGGSIDAGLGGFSLRAGTVAIRQANDSAINASQGAVDIAAQVLVDAPGASVGIQAVNAVSMHSLTHNAGIVMVSGDGLAVTGEVTVGGAGHDAVLRAGGHAAAVGGGFTVRDGGAVHGGAYTLGNGTGGQVRLRGGAIDGSDAQVTFRTTGPNGIIDVAGAGNRFLGDIDAGQFRLVVAAGEDTTLGVEGGSRDGLSIGSASIGGRMVLGSASAEKRTPARVTVQDGFAIREGGHVSVGYNGPGGHAIVTGKGGASSIFSLEKDGGLVLDKGGLALRGFGEVRLDGSLHVGWDGSAMQVTTLTSDGDIVLGAGATISGTDEFFLNARVGDLLMATDGNGTTISGNTGGGLLSMAGGLEYALSADRRSIRVAALHGDSRIDKSGSAEDRSKAYGNLTRVWSEAGISRDLSDIIYNISFMADGESGGKSHEILRAIANPSLGTADQTTLELVNGSITVGASQASVATAQGFTEQIFNRGTEVGRQFADFQGSAFGTDIMNQDYQNRVWAGAVGLWEHAPTRDASSGYEYDAYGFVLGYDRALRDWLAAGLAISYSDGEYRNTGAHGNNSSIENYTLGAYLTLSRFGFVGTLSASYTWSDNVLRELRTTNLGREWTSREYGTDTTSLGAVLGYDLLWGNLTLTPSLGLNHVASKNERHDVFVGGVATQRLRGRNRNTLVPMEVAARLEFPLGGGGRYGFEAKIGYTYHLKKDGLDGTIEYLGLGETASAKIASRPNSHHGYHAGVGLWYENGALDFSLKYDFRDRADSRTHRIMGTVGLSY